MEQTTAIRLIEKGIGTDIVSQKWLELGAGNGLFTTALASLLGEGSEIHAVDRDIGALDAIRVKPGRSCTIIKHRKDFIREPLDWEKWDGVLMANSLHFAADPLMMFRKIKDALQPSGRLVLVEYDTDTANPWVPYPLSFLSVVKLVLAAGYATATKMDVQPSRFNRAFIYSAVVLQR